MTWRVIEEQDEDGSAMYTLRNVPSYIEKYIPEGMATLPEGTQILPNQVRMPVAANSTELNDQLGYLFEEISTAFTKSVVTLQPARLKE